MRFEEYRQVLRIPGFSAFTGLGALAKAPAVAVRILLALHAAGLDVGYGRATPATRWSCCCPTAAR